MSWKNYILYLSLITGLISACDSFQDDMAPQGEDELVLKDAISGLPNTSLFIDLKKVIHTSNAVRFGINTPPTKGQAVISQMGVLRYDPAEGFLSGNDAIAIDLINESGAILDTDTIWITMTASADSLPCLNGALSDYYMTPKNQPIIFSPITNDGYCPDETSGAVLDFITAPMHGQIEQVELFTYRYTPDGFTGVDTAMYELTLVDNAGEEHYSLGQVTIEVFQEDTFSCDSLVKPVVYTITEDSLQSYIIPVFYADPLLCGSVDYSLEVTNVAFGQATVYDKNHLEYSPGMDTIDFIDFRVNFPDHSVSSTVTVLFQYQVDDSDSTSCLQANDDDYYLHVVSDSIGTSHEPYIINLAANDILCDLNYTIDLLTIPHIGVATINENENLVYYSDEEFAGTMETSFDYMLCTTTQCDTATVAITVEK